MPKILAFAGSTKQRSFNRKLVRIAASGAHEAGAEVKIIELADYPMPLFSEDLEASDGMPVNALRFKQLLIEHDGFLIASPEYNSAFSPLLKNVIDWASRAQSKDEPPLLAYKGKVASIMATSPGVLGGLRGLVFLRMLLGNIGVIVLPNQRAVGRAFDAFLDDGSLREQSENDAVKALGKSLARFLSRLNR